MLIRAMAPRARLVGRRYFCSASDAEIALASDSSDGKTRTIVLNNPEKRNALSLEMMKQIDAHLVDAQHLRAILIKATGGVFSSGHDLKELRGGSKDFQRRVFDQSADLVMKLRNFPTPIIGVVSDQAVAAFGTQLIASCDIVLATKRSTFSTPGGSVGLFCSTPGVALARAANEKLSKLMLLSGLPVDAEEALRGGLISKVYADVEELEIGVQKITDAILNKSKPIITLGKEFFHRQIRLSIEDAFKEGAGVMVKNLNHSDAKIGIDAFIKKETPKWTHDQFEDAKE